MHTDSKAHVITARSFFRQMRSYGYTPNQIIRIINELLELVTTSVREEQRTPMLAEATVEAGPRPSEAR
jgi:hypothetical protein